MKFLMFSDLHYDSIHDGDRRIDEIIAYAKENDSEFIIELGDLCYPIEANRCLIDKLSTVNLPCYFTVGNHNTDNFELADVTEFFNLHQSYYSFIKENIKFIILDANYIKKKDIVIPYSRNNYNKSTDDYPYIPKEEIEWLKSELEDDDLYYIIISHQSLVNDFQKRGISNRKEIREILEQRSNSGNRILFCINGHDHGGDVKVINNIHYYTLNSCSYIWHGTKDVFSYEEEIHKEYPYLKDLILYDKALHVIINIDDNMNVYIEGMEGKYQKHSSSDIGLTSTWNGVSIATKTLSTYIKR